LAQIFFNNVVLFGYTECFKKKCDASKQYSILLVSKIY
jgi:hypothetical protein